LLAAQAKGTPANIAVTGPDATLTYAELHAEADRLAGVLAAHGAGPDRLVAVLLPRTSELIVALLAVLKSGAAYLPLDPDLPTERIRTILRDARPIAVLTEQSTVDTDAPVIAVKAALTAPDAVKAAFAADAAAPAPGN